MQISHDGAPTVVSAEGSRLRRCDGLFGTLAVGYPLQAAIEGEELRVGGERGREREGAGEAQRDVSSPELCGEASERAIDIDDVRVDRGKELIDLRVGAVLQRAHDHLGVDGCRDQHVIACREVRSEQLDGSVMLRVGRIQEPDDDVGVEGYSRHSPRSSSR